MALFLGSPLFFKIDYRMNDLLKEHNLNICNTIYSTDELIETADSLKIKIPLQIIQLRDNNFRYNYFTFKRGFLEGGVLYKDLCKMLRQYIIANGLLLPDGSVKCNEYLRQYCKSERASFFDLVKQFILVIL